MARKGAADFYTIFKNGRLGPNLNAAVLQNFQQINAADFFESAHFYLNL